MPMNEAATTDSPLATVLINRQALRHNIQRLRELAPASRLIAVVKANAYGHGMPEVANTLSNASTGTADAFAVARPQEAFALRESGISQPIILLEGFFDSAQLPRIAHKQLQIVLHSLWQLTALEQAHLPQAVRVWIKLDSGMHRLGFPPQQIEEIYARLCACPQVCQPVNLLSHFSCADETPDSGTTYQQLTCFNQSLTGNTTVQRSLAASAGILRWPQAHFDWIRPGIILYGVSPFDDTRTGADFGFQPVMTLGSRLIAVRAHPAGAPVGYGGQWRSHQATRLGVIAFGYGDGYPQYAPSGTPVLVNGRQVPIVGRVSMDMICVDLGAGSQDRPGDPVIFWGDSLPVERIARATNSSAYELLTRLTVRLQYQYL